MTHTGYVLFLECLHCGHTHPFVIGVDAHAKTHTLAILAAPLGDLVDSAQFPTTHAGLQRALDWAARRTGADLDVLWVIAGIYPGPSVTSRRNPPSKL